MKKNKGTGSIFKHTAIYSISSVLQKAVGFIMLPIYASYLGAEGYGIVGMIDVVISALTVFVGFGITGAMYRFYYEKTTEIDKQTLVSTCLILMFGLVVGCSLPFFLFSEQLAWLAFGRDGLQSYLVLGLLTFIFDMGSASANGYIFIRQRSIFFSVLSLLKLIVGLSLNILLIVVYQLGVLGVLYSNLASTFLFFLVVQTYAFRRVGFRFSREQATAIVKYSLPLFPGYLAMFLRNNTDRVILAKYLGLGQLGVYGMLVKFASLIAVFLLTPFFNVWNNKRFEIAQQADGPATMARIFTLHLALMFFAGLVLALQVPLLLQILTPPEFWVPGVYAYLAVLAVILSASYYHFQFGMSYAKATMQISRVQIYSAILSVLLNLLLIGLFGLPGALIAGCCVYLIQCVLAYRFSRRHFSIPFEWAKIVRIVASATGFFLVCNAVSMAETRAGIWLGQRLPEALTGTLTLLHLQGVRDGKLLAYATNHAPLVLDGVLKLLLSLSFVLVLVLLGVLSKAQLLQPLQVFTRLKAGKQVLV